MLNPYRIIISPEAGTDIELIHQYVSIDSSEIAAIVVERILKAIESLSDFPHRTILQRQSRKLKNPVRSISVSSYTIYFRVIDNERVVRILVIHRGTRKRPKKFN